MARRPGPPTGVLLAGSLTSIVVPPPEIEAARDLMRAHDACRRDLMDARHRVSKLLLRHGRVYPQSSAWTVRHRGWLGRQVFEQPATELAYLDALACVDAISARKAALAQRLSELALDERWWPTVARLRCFHAIDTLTAFALHLELGGDWQRFARAPALGAWLGLTPNADAIGGVLPPRPHHQDRLHAGPPPARRGRLALRAHARPRHRAGRPPGRPARPRAADSPPLTPTPC
jgi:transposase